MSAVRLHLDEDADAHALLNALRQREMEVTSTREIGLSGSSDEKQLEWATGRGQVVYTYNAADFCRLHSAYASQGRRHSGILIGDQQTTSIGEETRRILNFREAKSAEMMENHLEFLSNWA